MCQPSDKIIFCTCDFNDDFPDEYWILHRFVKGRNIFVVGEPITPMTAEQIRNHSHAASIICSALKEDCFDDD
jgi:hypothetical protein